MVERIQMQFGPAAVLLIAFLWEPASVIAEPLSKTTFIYKNIGGVSIAADVYRSADKDARPVVLWIHGGALMTGSRNSVPHDLQDLAARKNFVLVSIDYRLAPEVKLPEIVDDVKDSLHWLHEKGPSLFHADANRVVVVGGSAGGFLSMLAGVIAVPKPVALVAYWGYGDIDGPWTTERSQNHGEPIAESAVKGSLDGNVRTNTDTANDQQLRGRYYRFLRQNGLWGREVSGFDPITQKIELIRFVTNNSASLALADT